MSGSSSPNSVFVVAVLFALAVGSIIYINFFLDNREINPDLGPDRFGENEKQVFRDGDGESAHNTKNSSASGRENTNSRSSSDAIRYSSAERKSIIDCENMLPLELQAPRFLGNIPNVTVNKGDNVSIPCVVENLGIYRLAWLKLESQSILAIHDHIITRNRRIGLSFDSQTFETPCKNRTIETKITMYTLHINKVGVNDNGFYMCQMNTDPMKGQWGYLNVEDPVLDIPESESGS